MRQWRLIGGIVVFLLSWSAAAHAQLTLYGPDYRAAAWLKVGITSEGALVFGVSGDLVPGTVGVEISPGSRVGLVRVFAGLEDGVPLTPQSCSYFVGASAVAVAAFGPGQPLHFGVRVGPQLEHIPIGTSGVELTSPQTAWALSYHFSWFPGVGHLHDGTVALGLSWAPHAYCESDD
jgi:hypothetical protein